MIGQWTFEKDTFYCSLPANVRLAREEAERDVQFAEVAQTFHRSNLNCNVSGKNYGPCSMGHSLCQEKSHVS